MDLAENCMTITEDIIGHYRLCEQLEAAASSVPQNIAEGNGRVSTKEYIHFLYIARGSLFETITLLNLFKRKGLLSNQKLIELESLGLEITKMINSLIKKQRNYL